MTPQRTLNLIKEVESAQASAPKLIERECLELINLMFKSELPKSDREPNASLEEAVIRDRIIRDQGFRTWLKQRCTEEYNVERRVHSDRSFQCESNSIHAREASVFS